MASITVADTQSFDRSCCSSHKLIVVLDSPALLPSLQHADVKSILSLKEADHGTLAAVAASLSQGTDAASKAECHFSGENGLQRVTVVMLPSAASRHNAPSRCHALGSAIKEVKSTKSQTILLLVGSEDHAFAQICAAGRQFPLFNMKSNEKGDQPVNIVVHFPTAQASHAKLLSRASSAVENIRLCQRLVDTPPNILHTDAYVAECRVLADKLGVNITVIQGKELEERGFGGLWGVGKASEHLPALVVLSYTPSEVVQSTSVCLVGKGIVYDTGGLSIKTPTTNMAGMKNDMGGSAAALGAFVTAVSAGQLTRPLHCVLCLAENSVGPLATRPDDIHRLLSGKTVEVNNTDAEGRLVLSDGVFYCHQTLAPAVIVDIATLTGAQLIATGKKHAAMYCSHDELEQLAVVAGKYTGDLTHPLPYAPELFRNEFRSCVADMKNSVADRGNAQSSCAGQFIGNHLEEYLAAGGQWLHVDMAGPSAAGERATGYGVALLFDLVLRLNSTH